MAQLGQNAYLYLFTFTEKGKRAKLAVLITVKNFIS
jgi:hypothetical protein